MRFLEYLSTTVFHFSDLLKLLKKWTTSVLQTEPPAGGEFANTLVSEGKKGEGKTRIKDKSKK